MQLGKQIIGPNNFSFDYFLDGGVIDCTCLECGSKITLPIKIYQSGHSVELLEKELIQDLVNGKVINLNDEPHQAHWGKYVLWKVGAAYEFIHCPGCHRQLIAIFGMGELQPGLDQVQFKGIWYVEHND